MNKAIPFCVIFFIFLIVSPGYGFSNSRRSKKFLSQMEESSQLLTKFIAMQSFSSPYENVGNRHSGWTTHGGVVLNDDYIRLTPSVKNRVGYLSNTYRMSYPEWRVSIELMIGGGGRHGADGMAFWYVSSPLTEGPVFGGPNRWDGMVIFIDTFDNDGKSNNPTISLAFNNGDKLYDSSDDGASVVSASCDNVPLRGTMKSFTLELIYIDSSISLRYSENEGNSWTHCFTQTDVILPRDYFFGLSAATGGLFDNHDIVSFSTYTNPNKPGYVNNNNNNNKNVKESEVDPEEIVENGQDNPVEKNIEHDLEEKLRELEELQAKLRDRELEKERENIKLEKEEELRQLKEQQETRDLLARQQEIEDARMRDTLRNQPPNPNQNQNQKSPPDVVRSIQDSISPLKNKLDTVSELLQNDNIAFSKKIQNNIEVLQGSYNRRIDGIEELLKNSNLIVNNLLTTVSSMRKDIHDPLKQEKKFDVIIDLINANRQAISDMKSMISTTASSKSGPSGFWIAFIFLEVILFFAVIYWKKYHDNKTKFL